MKINKVVRISLSGGIIGLLLTNPRRALEDRIRYENDQGWNAIYVIHHGAVLAKDVFVSNSPMSLIG